MPTPQFEAAVRRRVAELYRRMGEDVRQLREDAGLSRLAVARAAGLSDTYVGRIEDGSERPSHETLVRLGSVLGADLTTRFYPNTGPLIRDRHQARMLEGLLGQLHPRWHAFTEVAVRRPSRGWIDVVLHEPREAVALASELQSELRRLEQVIRWSAEKAASLPSWDRWPHLDPTPRIERLLIVRRTRATRHIAATFANQVRAAYPAHPDDALASLTGAAPWPGAALIWSVIDARGARLVGGR
jgi:transcriptional regulator with XRE-family HTH domain